MVLFAQSEETAYLATLRTLIKDVKNKDELYKAVVNSPFTDRRKSTLLGLGLVCLMVVNKTSKTIDCLAHSDVDYAKSAVRLSEIPFDSMKIPYNYHGNFIAEAIRSDRYQQTSDWQYILSPLFSPSEARLKQSENKVGCTFVYPLVNANRGAALVFNFYLMLDQLESQQRSFMHSYATMVAKFFE
jgi:hypothetical protein